MEAKPHGQTSSLRKSDQLQIGKAAEYLVCADLILQGYSCFLTDAGCPYDLVVDLGVGRLLRVQVKGCEKPHKVAQRRESVTFAYHYHVRRAGKGGNRRYTNDEFDLLALVALDQKIIAYMPIVGMKTCIQFQVPNSKDTYQKGKKFKDYPFINILDAAQKSFFD